MKKRVLALLVLLMVLVSSFVQPVYTREEAVFLWQAHATEQTESVEGSLGDGEQQSSLQEVDEVLPVSSSEEEETIPADDTTATLEEESPGKEEELVLVPTDGNEQETGEEPTPISEPIEENGEGKSEEPSLQQEEELLANQTPPILLGDHPVPPGANDDPPVDGPVLATTPLQIQLWSDYGYADQQIYHVKVQFDPMPDVDEQYFTVDAPLDSQSMYQTQSPTIEFDLRSSGKYDDYICTIQGAYVGQTFTVTYSGVPNKTSIIQYLCKAGRVKESVAGAGEENSVQCDIRSDQAYDENGPVVTDPEMINRVNIRTYTIPQGTDGIPFSFTWYVPKGEISAYCSAYSSGTSISARLHFAEYEDAELDYPLLAHSEEVQFRSKGNDSEGNHIIGYDAREGVTHQSVDTYDVFSKEGSFIPYEAFLEPGTTLYYLSTIYTPKPRRQRMDEYRLLLTADENRQLQSYEIWRLKDDDGVPLAEPQKVERIEMVFRGSNSASLTIINNTPSAPDEYFDYELRLPPVESDQPERVGVYNSDATTETVFPSGEPIQFRLKHGESFYVEPVSIGTTYTTTQKKKDGITETTAVIDDSHQMHAASLEESADAHVLSAVPLEVETVYIPLQEEMNMPVPEPCHPPVLPYGMFRDINFKALWNNAGPDDLKVRIRKLPDQTMSDIGESTLAGAQFMVVQNTSRQVFSMVTDENGVAEVAGLDPAEGYVIYEIKAPKGFDLSPYIYAYNTGYNSPAAYEAANTYEHLRQENQVAFFSSDIVDEDGTPVLEIMVQEPVKFTTLMVRKFYLPDESKYDGPLFEIKYFRMPHETVDFNEAIWDRSFFENVEGVEFLLTLNSAPDDPRYTYRAVTGPEGRSSFRRELPLQPGEEELALYSVYYGTYTLKEINTPEGMAPIEEQTIVIEPPYSNPQGYDITIPASVMRIVNVKAKGNLSIEKEVAGEAADEQFTFTVEFFQKDGEESTEAYAYTGSKEGELTSGDTITLAHGESILFEDLPAGLQYRVTEQGVDGYSTKVNGEETTIAEGTIAHNETAKVHFVNTPPTPPEDPPKEDPPKEDPPKDPPKETPPKKDPPKPTPVREVPKTGDGCLPLWTALFTAAFAVFVTVIRRKKKSQ